MDAIFVMICCRDKHGYPVVTFPCVACKFDQDNRLIKKKHIVCIAWWYIHRICVAIYDSNYCSFVSNEPPASFSCALLRCWPAQSLLLFSFLLCFGQINKSGGVYI
jgi:hypothetical protein